MKKILKEWRAFLREADETDKPLYPTGTGARGDKYIQSLQTRRDITKEEALKLELAYRIVNIFAGFGDSEGVIANNVVLAHEVLDDLKTLSDSFAATYEDVSNEYFKIYMVGSQREKRGSREKSSGVSYILEAADFYPAKVSFEATEDIDFYAYTLDNMLEDGDFDFELFKGPTERRNFFDTKARSADQGTGGIQKPPNLTPEEDAQFDKMVSPWALAARDVLNILDDKQFRDNVKPREWYNILLKHSEEAYTFLSYLYDLWNYKTGGEGYFNQTMVSLYKDGAEHSLEEIERIKKIIDELPPTQEETLEDLISKARAGDKEAAGVARKMLVQLKRSKDAREMRMIQLGRG